MIMLVVLKINVHDTYYVMCIGIEVNFFFKLWVELGMTEFVKEDLLLCVMALL